MSTLLQQLLGFSGITGNTTSTYSYKWVEFDPPIYPEGDYVAVFCEKCQRKNRQDEGWRHRRRPALQILQRKMQYERQMASMGITDVEDDLAQREYECGECRSEPKAKSEEEAEEEEEEAAAPAPSVPKTSAARKASAASEADAEPTPVEEEPEPQLHQL
jgi:hypothetical protein